jgi:hypothetical protein
MKFEVTISLLILNQMARAANLIVHFKAQNTIELVSTAALTFSFVLSILIVNIERIKGLPSSGLMLLFWLMLSLGSFVSMHSMILDYHFYVSTSINKNSIHKI